MKRNKIAAAALALALATPVVANAASTTTESTTSNTRTTEAGVGEFAITKEYRESETAFIKAWDEWVAAQADTKAAEAKVAEAQAKYDAAKKALADFEVIYDSVNGTYYTTLARLESERQTQYATYKAAGGSIGYATLTSLTRADVNKAGTYVSSYATATDSETQAKAVKDIIALNETIKDNTKDANWIIDKRADLKADVARRLAELNEAKNNLQTARNKEDAAKSAYDTAKAKYVANGASRTLIRRAEEAGDVSIVRTTTTTTTPAPAPAPSVSTTTSTTVGTAPAKTEKGITAEQRAALEKAIAEAEKQIAAVQILKDTTPKTIAKVVDKLDALVKAQEARIATAKAALSKTTASVFFSTAYADEDVDIDALTKEINDSTQEIKDVLKENEEAQPEADKKEDVKEEDKKEDVKEEDKKEDVKEEDKKEDDKKVIEKTTTVLTPATTNKTAGSNAKTGIAGVAGVAGILAAASAAYAASKKN